MSDMVYRTRNDADLKAAMTFGLPMTDDERDYVAERVGEAFDNYVLAAPPTRGTP